MVIDKIEDYILLTNTSIKIIHLSDFYSPSCMSKLVPNYVLKFNKHTSSEEGERFRNEIVIIYTYNVIL